MLLLSGEVPSMMELPLAWVAVMSVLVVEDPVLVMAGRMLLPPTCVADRFMVVRVPVMLLVEPGLMWVVVVLVEAGLLLVTCRSVTSVLTYLMF